ncbi:MAG: hypothetical protein H0W62_15210 [Chitinophagales bacterium]|nr:hypothetical protein [Chitinophagales bacterium]
MKYTAQVIIEDLKRNRNSLLYHLKVDAADRIYQVWERNPLAVELFTERIMWQKLEYIHNNPATTVGDWQCIPKIIAFHLRRFIF